MATVMAAVAGQAKGTNPDFKGKVVDSSNESMPYATVVLLTNDSTFVQGTVSDMDGLFEIPTNVTQGILRISSIGYETAYLNLPVAENMTVVLKPESQQLAEVEIKATRPKTQLTPQGLETSIQGTVLETRGSAKDVLENVPGMIRGQDGLEVLGKGKPVVYINGRLMRDAAELDRLLSNEILSVEVINNPGAQYDASVTAVVRIKTVKHQGDGFSFNAVAKDEQSLRYKSFNDPTTTLNMNYRVNGLDFFAGGTFFTYHNRQDATFIQQTFGTPGYVQDAALYNDMDYRGWNANGGINWQINDIHSVGFRIDRSSDYRARTDQRMTEKFYKDGLLADTLSTIGTDREDGNPVSTGINAYYNGVVGKMSIDLNADWYASNSGNKAETFEKGMVEDAVVRTDSKNSSNLLAYKLVLGYPVAGGMLEAGTEQTFARHSDEYTTNIMASSSSEVKENNLGFFAQYGRVLFGRAQMSVGLRYEHVGYNYDDLAGVRDTSITYDNLFPTVALAGVIGPVQASLSYSAKTQRPGFSNLSDAVRYNSRYVWQRGNSKLQSMTQHELGLSARWNVFTFITQYSRTDNPIVQWSYLYNNDGVVMVDLQNKEKPIRTLACYVNAAPTIGIWTMNYLVGFQNQWFKIDYPGRELDFSNKPMWVIQAFNTFTLPLGFQASVDGEFHSKAYTQNMWLTVNYFCLNASIQKTFLPDRSLVLRIDGQDLTRTANTFVHADFGGHIHDQNNIMDTQKIACTLRYTFNAARSKYKGTGAGQETLERMK